MPHFDIPLDLPHAGRIADRIVALLEKHIEELGLNVPEVTDTADRLSSYLFRNTSGDDNPPNAMAVRDEAAKLARRLPTPSHRIALDEAGSALSSEAFAKHLAALRDGGCRDLVFLIGGPDGLARVLREVVIGWAKEISSLM